MEVIVEGETARGVELVEGAFGGCPFLLQGDSDPSGMRQAAKRSEAMDLPARVFRPSLGPTGSL